jgi:iron complex outermembrane receptor protein
VGNPTLDPVRNTEFDGGVRFRSGAFSLDATLFVSALSDWILVLDRPILHTDVGVANSVARSYVNHDARMRGGEATATWTGARWSWSAGACATRGRQATDASLGITDPDLPEIPPLRVRASTRYDTGRWFLEGEGIAAAEQDRVNADLSEARTAGWGIVNLRGGYTVRSLSIVAGVDNAFGRYYVEHLSYYRDPFRSGARVPEPGRTVTVSVLVRG